MNDFFSMISRGDLNAEDAGIIQYSDINGQDRNDVSEFLSDNLRMNEQPIYIRTKPNLERHGLL